MDQCFVDQVYRGFKFERTRGVPPESFPALPPIPGGRYTDPAFLEHRSTHITLWPGGHSLMATPNRRAVESKGFRGSRLSYQERRNYHWHEELDRRIGAERIPEALRVSPRLSGMVEA